ncbi:NADH-quinone oxidoreductase subunit J [Solimonas sp. K1W22B-7]|uniref:NADH-quinone oxidoreductase subunit J n=1 Tax=Solimonas sp. K1W22B-7 TaxID=2303331 RepID=UPI000E3356D7|nr:NADH-quinone oxidoreductase subunit J [Solimonas sp. K1W22B-7]AXQ28833.1 NADH-quinone oxidoreductase subunit J [Solimonas sp. K1W22B-7]
MEILFYVAAAIALFSTAMVVTSPNPVHALLYLVLSLLAVATTFFTLGAPFAGVLQVIVYAGAILVLFVFVVMMLNLGRRTVEQERIWLSPMAAAGPAILATVLLYLLGRVILPDHHLTDAGLTLVDAKTVGIVLYGPYLLAVELASMLLLAGLVAAYHLGKSEQ